MSSSEKNFLSNCTLKSGFGFGGIFNHVISKKAQATDEIRLDSEDGLSVDEYWMTEALRESHKSVGISNPNPAVGCVIVKDGVEIARGHTQAYGGVHAERMAFSKVKNQSLLRGATVYVTLEPCSHFGHQPPCADLLAHSGVKRVVVGRGDPDGRVSGRGLRKLLTAGKIVTKGLLAPEITAWNYPFFLTRSTQEPVVALKWAQTLDGQLADDWGASKWISGSPSRAYTHWLRQKYDVTLVGVGTFLADGPKLDVRDCDFIQRQPVRAVFDPQGKLFDLDAHDPRILNLLSNLKASPVCVLTAENIFQQQPKDHWLKEKVNFGILPTPTGSRRGPVDSILKALNESAKTALGKPLQSILVEGGPKLLSSFLKEGAGDILHVFIAPKMTAGKMNRIKMTLPLEASQKYDVVSTAILGDDMVMEMTPQGRWNEILREKPLNEAMSLGGAVGL